MHIQPLAIGLAISGARARRISPSGNSLKSDSGEPKSDYEAIAAINAAEGFSTWEQDASFLETLEQDMAVGKSCADDNFADTSLAHRQVSGYTMQTNQHCGGTWIEFWADGHGSGYGSSMPIGECVSACNAHAECLGFYETADTGCAHFRSSIALRPSAGRTCYVKDGALAPAPAPAPAQANCRRRRCSGAPAAPPAPAHNHPHPPAAAVADLPAGVPARNGYGYAEGQKCGGSWIEAWANGVGSGYGEASYGIPECAAMCNLHPECHAFYYKHANQKCSHYRTGDMSLTETPGYDCYYKPGSYTPPAPPPVVIMDEPPRPQPLSQNEYLQIIDDALMRTPRNPMGLMQTYGPNALGGGPCGSSCGLAEPCPTANYGGSRGSHCRHDVYDNALASIYFTKRGKHHDSKRILDGIISLMYLRRPQRHAYGPWMAGIPSNRTFALPAASYTDEMAHAGDYLFPAVSSSAIDTGNLAWLGMAFARYAAATGDACYATVAHDILWVLRSTHRCEDEFGGFMGRLPPGKRYYRSIEHNIDMFAFARMLGSQEDMESASRFVTSMMGKNDIPGVYHIGTGGEDRCDMSTSSGHAPTDAQVWSTAAQVDSHMSHQTSAIAAATTEGRSGMWETDVDYIGNNGEQAGATYQGVKFAAAGNGIQWEVTSGAVLGMIEFQRQGGSVDVTAKIHEARESIKRLIQVYRTVPPSVMGGNINAWHQDNHDHPYPGGSDTGLGWTYLRYPHVASVSWAGLLMLYQPEDGAPIDNEGNPFSAPSSPVPAATQHNLQCLPHMDPIPPPQCRSWSGCAHLSGECCPNRRGHFLGCCDD